MADYRAYILDEDGHINRAVEFVFPHDEAAKNTPGNSSMFMT
jgi:hypothetical protein